MPMRVKKEALEELYQTCNRRELVHPDPLEFLYDYGDLHDREIAALVASSLAYGRVRQILKSVSAVLSRMSPSPCGFVKESTEKEIGRAFAGFKHRFTTGGELSRMLVGAKAAIAKHGSLHGCFAAGFKKDDPTVLPALSRFAAELSGGRKMSLLPLPGLGSACKRLNLFLRWMVRRDEVDPGGWAGVPASKLIVPLDTHMHRIGRAMGLTRRKAADMRTALEITAAFASVSPDDPVRYDFALTRLGIRDDMDAAIFLKRYKALANCR
ncbi:MAG: TIGR02757 family protein [Pseudomonadota bacterium]